MSEQKDWLVRTANNVISGPFNREQVSNLIREGKLTSQDEVCHSCKQWIFLHEREEILRHLGVEVPLKGADLGGDDSTQVDTLVVNREQPAIPDLPREGDPDFNPERTGVMVRSPMGRAELKQNQNPATHSEQTLTPSPISAKAAGIGAGIGAFKRGAAVIHQPQTMGTSRNRLGISSANTRKFILILALVFSVLIAIVLLNI